LKVFVVTYYVFWLLKNSSAPVNKMVNENVLSNCC